jgi:hypothetical protein
MRFAAAAIGFLLGVSSCWPCWAQEFSNTDTPALVTLTAAGAGTTNSADQFNRWGRGLQLGINISAKSGTIAVTVSVQGKDIASGTYYPICTSASLTAAGFTNVTVFPGTTPAANTDCNVPLSATWRVQVISGAGVTPSVTMTVGASLIL